MKRTFLLCILFLFVFYSCKKDSIDPLPNPEITILSPSAERVTFEPGEFVLKVVSNVELEIIVPDTVRWLEKSGESVNNDTTIVPFHFAINTSDNKRGTVVTVKQKGGALIRTVSVEQGGCSGEFPGVDPGDLEGDSPVPVHHGWASSFQYGSEIEKSFDGDPKTIYHSNWSNTDSNYFPIVLEYYFENASRIDYVIYYPRADSGYNGRFREVEVWVKTKQNPAYTLTGTFDFEGRAQSSRVDFPEGVQQPEGIKFVVKSGVGDRGGFASCSEMMFFQKKALDSVFTDATCSVLAPGVTYEQIMNMNNEFLKNIAKALYLGSYPSASRIQLYKPYRDPDKIASEFKTNSFSRLDNPTGIYIGANQELVVFVGDLPQNERIGLYHMDWRKEYSVINYDLKPGTNKITTTGDGLLYIAYNTESYQSVAPVKIHIATGVVNGKFDILTNKDSDWKNLLETAISASGYLDLLGEYAHLTFPVSYFQKLVTSPVELLKAYDKLVWLEQDISGIFKYGRTIKNRLFFHSVTGDHYMYATNYHTAYHEKTLEDILDVDKFKTSAIWGPAHEVGHVFQPRPGLKWIGMTEVSNNIYSLYVQTSFGNRSRLVTELLPDQTNRYEAAFASMIVGRIPHGQEKDVFCKVVPFWQLYLYNEKVKGNVDFYRDLHEMIRVTPDPMDFNTKNGKCQLNFVRMVCDQMQMDLTEFFRSWGFLSAIDERVDDYVTERLWITEEQIASLEDYIKAKNYPKAPSTLIYLNDDNWACFRTNAAISPGNVTNYGMVVLLTGWLNVVAYEVYQNNKLISVFNRDAFMVPAGNIEIKAVAADGTRVPVPLS